MKTRTNLKLGKLPESDIPVLRPGMNNTQRVAPPEGRVAYRGKVLDMTMASLGRRINTNVAGVGNIEQLGVINNTEVRENLDSTFNRYGELGIKGVVTSSYRTVAGNYAVGGVQRSDHPRGLALDVAYGDYESTKAAFLKLLSANTNKGYIRQIIFENVRGTSKGYHIHIGFYEPGETGKVQSTLYFTLGSEKFQVLKSVADIPSKEKFENA